MSDLDKIKCPHCVRTPIDGWLIINKDGNKHFYIKCLCRKESFCINRELSEGLNIPIRQTKVQKKEERLKRQGSLL